MVVMVRHLSNFLAKWSLLLFMWLRREERGPLLRVVKDDVQEARLYPVQCHSAIQELNQSGDELGFIYPWKRCPNPCFERCDQSY